MPQLTIANISHSLPRIMAEKQLA